MVDGQGYLIINRECVSEDIEDFEYTPKPEFEGPFSIFNEKNEIDLINRFFEHIKELKPNVYVTFNGDFFDWPFVDSRAALHGISMTKEIGVFKNSSGEYRCRFASHLDAYKWVMRDSYLPVGSQGLKAVTKAKLGYDPVEVDPEDMVRFALEKPQTMASYSVSDAVATYYLYMKYVHPFIFSLCTIIPMNPDDVLRKGSGTLCETLLMVEAANANIIFPNKQIDNSGNTYDGHLLESETYVGGHVEALQSGVFRNDIPERFELDPNMFQELIDQLDKTLKYTIEIEENMIIDDIENYNEVFDDILSKLMKLKSNPNLKQCPNIYHLDVGAMYPNIILTNRLQPSSIVSNEDCASCIFNSPENECKRNMEWTWRGDYIPATSAEYRLIIGQLEAERFKPSFDFNTNNSSNNNNNSTTSNASDGLLPYSQLPKSQKDKLLITRLKEYSKKVYGKTHQIKEEERVGTVCQRENPFYVDTVRAFRDRRYKYKNDLKTWKGKLDKAYRHDDIEEIQEAKNMNILYDSLQLAHKCILNSFYGYVMRKGARWFSMEMAGIVTHSGAHIIKRAREVLDGVGKPLELDTDGIWTLLPNSFPENYEFKVKSESILKYKKKNIIFSYPCVVLNYRVRDQFINTQYQTLLEDGSYEKKEECSIFFEVDGPYRAMILPASTEEGKKLKKRYAVFNNDAEGSLAELKGFEIKRRGELKLIKLFQSQVFKTFLKGNTKEECYSEVGKIADHWLDILYTKGKNMIEEELLSLISCSSNMSRKLEDYGSQKSTAITTAKRLAEFLGNQVVRDKGLACRFIIASRPARAPVVERAIPVAIFSAEKAICKHYLQKWTGVNINSNFNIRDIIDWDYYITRFGGTIRKIVTIPAALQKVDNPVPRLQHPSWLLKKIQQNSGIQKKITFEKKSDSITDIENLIGSNSSNISNPSRPIPRVSKINRKIIDNNDNEKEIQLKDKPMPSITENYDEWLEWSKARWKDQRNNQKQTKNSRKRTQRPMSMSPNNNAPASKRRMLLNSNLQNGGGFLARQQATLYECNWEIIQVTPIENIPGSFTVWSLVDGKMYPIQLSVPHTFYVHSRFKNPNNIESFPYAKLVEKNLPHSKKRKFLYELELTELQYQKHKNDIQAFSNLPEVEGIYETQVPNIFRVLMKIGCICKFEDNSESISEWQKKQMSSNHMKFTLHQLKRIDNNNNNNNIKYLNYDLNIFKLCYLYYSCTESRSVYCLIFPHTKQVHLFFISVLPKCSTPNIESMYETYLPGYNFQMQLFKQQSQAIQQLNTLIIENKRKYPGPSIFLLQDASMDGAHQNLTTMLNDKRWSSLREYPVVPLNGNQKDNQHPAFAWEGYYLKLISNRFKNGIEWFKKHSNFCQYTNIPIGNLTSDYPILSSDLSYARILDENNYLLWISPTTFPDLGTASFSNASLIDEIRFPEHCKSSCLTKVTVSLELRNLALATILQSHHVNDIEHIHGNGGGSNTQQNSFKTNDTSNKKPLDIQEDSALDDSLLCFPVFRILKQLVSKWVLDLENSNENIQNFSDIILDHIYRWLSSPTSKLYDPALLHYIHSLMKKVFLQLLAEFKKLGSSISYASFNQLIITTPKFSSKDARTYMNFTLDTIKKKKLFSWLSIEVNEYWEVAMFMDRANYSAISVDENGNTEITSKWDLSNYLPSTLKPSFEDIANEYTKKLHDLIYNSEIDSNNIINSDGNNNNDDDDVNNDVENKEMNTNKILVTSTKEPKRKLSARKEIIRKEITPRLFRLVHDAQHSMTTVQESSTSTTSPALHFIQYICKVLSLDDSISQEIVKLQKNLFKLAQVREFSKEAEFVNPSKTYILYDVMCQFCSAVTNIDLLRDSRLLDGNWKCLHCDHEYDKIGIEKRLIDILKRKSLAYQLQDIVCEKCSMIKEDNTGLYCKNCSGKFISCLSLDEIQLFINKFQQIGETHNFQWLLEISTWLADSTN